MWTHKNMSKLGLGLVAVAMLGLANTAQAQTHAKTYEVVYSQSEISTQSGAQHIYKRIQDVAFTSCKAEFGGERFVTKRREMKKCVLAVTQDLVEKANHNTLDQISREHLNNRNVDYKQLVLK